MYIKRSMTFVIIAVLATLAVTIGVLAGTNFDSPSGPTDSASQMYTLEQVYDRANDGTAATKMTTFTEPSGGPGATMHDLNALYTLVSERSRPAETGQTASSATGDDGDLKKGVDWPSPRFTDNGDGTVTDNLTGLTWLKNANCPNAPQTWSAALSDVAQLNSDGTMNGNNCGDTSHQTDWRLPNVRELHSLIHYGVYNPALPNTAGTGKWTSGDPFTNVQSNRYWSSTTSASDTNYAWYVSLDNGNVHNNAHKALAYYVWPVRGGQ